MSEFVDMVATGRELLSGRSAKTADRFGKDHGLDVFLINGRRHYRRSDVLKAIEASRIVPTTEQQPSSLKTMLEKISADVLAKRSRRAS